MKKSMIFAALALSACAYSESTERTISTGLDLVCGMAPLVVSNILTERGISTYDQDIIAQVFSAGCAIRAGRRSEALRVADTTALYCGYLVDGRDRALAYDNEWAASKAAACGGVSP